MARKCEPCGCSFQHQNWHSPGRFRFWKSCSQRVQGGPGPGESDGFPSCEWKSFRRLLGHGALQGPAHWVSVPGGPAQLFAGWSVWCVWPRCAVGDSARADATLWDRGDWEREAATSRQPNQEVFVWVEKTVAGSGSDKILFRMFENEEKVKLRRLEPAIQKFTKIVIPTDLERLRKHQINIEKYQRCRIWDKLHEEHINAGRTVQQLRSNIREMEKLCLKVRKDDLILLKRMIDPVKEAASAATAEFLQLHLASVEELKKQFNDEEALLQPSLTRSMTVGGAIHTPEAEAEADSQSLTQIYALPEIPRDQNAAESWETLEADLIELNQLVTDFSLLVNSQQEKIDSIADHVNTAAVNVEEGTKNLGKAAKYKLAALPVAGALIGGVVGGPIGLLAGFKVAGIAAALGGGVLGFTGGKLIQRRKQKMMEKLTSSCPDLHSQTDKKCS
ncbi:syntaxin-17 isoform X2 [Heterocephalus glaber]|uniref:Syntaxin-17 n=1 Tax=Heterocephalus glaber TaxID=10181 RepID=A0AAX6RSB8_HETGA|nr:syntaxin-17 isoform X2 [Heterocephalus glaber]